MTTIGRFSTAEQAHLMRLHLGSAGIEAWVQDDSVLPVLSAFSPELGGVRVQVADEDVVSAREFLAADQPADECGRD